MKKFLIIFLFTVVTLFGQGRFYADGNDLKPKDPNWAIDVDHIKIKNLDLIPSISSEIDSIAERVDTLRNVKKVYLVNGTDTTEIYDNGDTVYVSPSGGRPIKLGNVTVDDISVQNIYVLQGGSSYLVEGQLGSDATVILDSTMTRDEIQDSINMIPKNLGGHTLTFQFSDGTYTLDSTLYFNNFYGGFLNIYGNLIEEDESTLHSDQAVIFNSSTTGNAINLEQNQCAVRFINIKVDAQFSSRVLFINRSMDFTLKGCYIIGNSNAGSYGIRIQLTSGVVWSNYVSTSYYAIAAFTANIFSWNNDDIGTLPSYGLYATNSGIIGKHSTSVQPSGSIADEVTTNGGVIR